MPNSGSCLLNVKIPHVCFVLDICLLLSIRYSYMHKHTTYNHILLRFKVNKIIRGRKLKAYTKTAHKNSRQNKKFIFNKNEMKRMERLKKKKMLVTVTESALMYKCHEHTTCYGHFMEQLMPKALHQHLLPVCASSRGSASHQIFANAS